MRRGNSGSFRGSRGGRGGGHNNNANIPHIQSIDTPPLEAVVGRLETMSKLLHAAGRNSTRPDEIHEEIRLLLQDLTLVGPQLETTYPEVLDRVISSMRDASAQPQLPPTLRLAIFQLVELRAAHWSLPSDTNNYYRSRSHLSSHDGSGDYHGESKILGDPIGASSSSSSAQSTNSTNSLVTLEGNKTFREEIVIKNSDSGKVMGVRGKRVHLIEALSDTIISFEKVVPNAKDRILSINGYSSESINAAKELIQETIARNASPVLDSPPELKCEPPPPEANSVKQGSFEFLTPPYTPPEFTYSVQLGESWIKISGDNLGFIQEGKLVLDEYFGAKYPDLFFSNYPSDEGVSETEPRFINEPRILLSLDDKQDEDVDETPTHKYERQTLLLLGMREKLNCKFPALLVQLDKDTYDRIVVQKCKNLDKALLQSSCSE